jgi:hypothetical protein
MDPEQGATETPERILNIPHTSQVIQNSTSNSAFIKTKSSRLIASGLMIQPCKQPLLAVHPSGAFPSSFDVIIHMYLPDNSTNVDLDPNYYPWLNDIKSIETEAGSIRCRIIAVQYDNPRPKPEVYAYSLWSLTFRYIVVGEEAHAVFARYSIGDPETTRGPITTVEKA